MSIVSRSKEVWPHFGSLRTVCSFDLLSIKRMLGYLKASRVGQQSWYMGQKAHPEWKKVGLSGLEKRRLGGEIISFCSEGGEEEGCARLSFLGTDDKMCGNSTKFHQGRFRLGIRKNLHKLPRLVDAHASQCSTSIWIMPSLMFFNFWLALE